MRNITLLAVVLSVLATFAYASTLRGQAGVQACLTHTQVLQAAADSRHGISTRCNQTVRRANLARLQADGRSHY